MKSKKGFTLVELLGVIIILAVILLIAVPKITNIIDESKKEAYKSSVQGYINSILSEQFYNNNLVTYQVTNGISSPKVEIRGDMSEWNGIVQIDGGNSFKIVMASGEYCATSEFD